MSRLALSGNARTRNRLTDQPAVAALTLSQAILALTPVGYWKLDESAGTTATDSSGNGRDGTYSGTYTLHGWTGPDGVQYATFNNGRVSIADNNAFSANTASGITLLAFLLADSSIVGGSTTKFLISKGDASGGGQYEWQLAVNQSGADNWRQDFFSLGGSNMSNETWGGGPAISSTVARMVVTASAAPVFNQRFDFYLNSATPKASSQAGTSNVTYVNGTAAVNIANRADSPANLYWVGGIAQVAIFAGKLNSTQVASIRTAAIGQGWSV